MTGTAASAPAPGPAPAGVDPSADRDDLRASLQAIRTNVQQWTAGIGAVATAVFTGVGWSQADRLFPLAGGSWVPWVAGISAGAAIVAAVYILVRLYAAQRRILVGNEDEIELYGIRFWGDEKRLVYKALAEQAHMEGAPKLVDVDLRAQRLDRIASRLELEGNQTWLAEGARQESDRLNAYVGLAELRVILMLLERRAERVTNPRSTVAVALAVVALAVAGLFTAANYSQGAREKANTPVTHTSRQ